MGDFVVGPSLEGTKYLLGFCCNRADYFDDLQNDLERLQHKLLRLKNIQGTIKQRVDKERRPDLQPTCRVSDWLVTSAELQKRVVKVIGEAEHEIRHQCLRMFIPRCCCSYHRIGKRVSRMLIDVDQVLADSRFDHVVERQMEESWITNLTAELQKTYRNILEYITDPSFMSIGIYNADKSATLSKQINTMLSCTHDFDVVVSVEVSEAGDIAEAQEAILRQLGVRSEDTLWINKNEYERSCLIREEMKMKKFALLLCDLWKPWKESDVFKVGVPSDYKTQGSKLIFTTPSKKVFKRMIADKSIRISSLPKEAPENWSSRVWRHLLCWHKYNKR